MLNRLFPVVPRLLLAVLLATFLSPGFGWQVVTSHSGAVTIAAVVAPDEAGHDHDADADHHESAAHGDIGHLLSHLPGFVHHAAQLPAATAAGIAYPPPQYPYSHADAEPPFKPPRSFPFA